MKQEIKNTLNTIKNLIIRKKPYQWADEIKPKVVPAEDNSKTYTSVDQLIKENPDVLQ